MQPHYPSIAARLLNDAGFKARQIDSIHKVIVSELFRGRELWQQRLEDALLDLTDDPALVAEIKAAAIAARKEYLADELMKLAQVSA